MSLDVKKYVMEYKKIVDEMKEIDIEDKSKEIAEKILNLENEEKQNADLHGNTSDRKADEKLTYDLVENYGNEQDEINKLREKQEKLEENRKKYSELENKRDELKKIVKLEYYKNKADINKEIERLNADHLIDNKRKKIEELEKQKEQEWKRIQEDVENGKYPNYEEYERLENEIESENKSIEFWESQNKDYKELLKSLNSEYQSILQNFIRIDAGQEVTFDSIENIDIKSNDSSKKGDEQADIGEEEKPKGKTESKSTEEGKPKGTTESKSTEEGKPKGETEGKSTEEGKPKGTTEGKSTEEGKPKGTTKRKTEGKPVEEMDLEGLDERIIDETQRMIDEENSKPKTTKNKPEIVISRKPSINYSKYNIRIGSLRKIMKQKPDQIVTKLQGLLPTKSIQELKKLSENIDPVLLEGIIQLKNKNILTENEINEALKEFDDEKASKKGIDFNVTYDMKDLSKWAFLPWNRKDRDKIAQLAEDNRDRGIANFKDGQEYEPNPIKRMFKRVRRGKLGEGKAREEEQSEEQVQEGQSEEEQLKKVKLRNKEFYEYVKNTEVGEYFKIINELNKTSDEKDIKNIVENAKKAVLDGKITPDEYNGLLYNVKFKKEKAEKEKAAKPNEKSESGKEGPEDDGEERQ